MSGTQSEDERGVATFDCIPEAHENGSRMQEFTDDAPKATVEYPDAQGKHDEAVDDADTVEYVPSGHSVHEVELGNSW